MLIQEKASWGFCKRRSGAAGRIKKTRMLTQEDVSWTSDCGIYVVDIIVSKAYGTCNWKIPFITAKFFFWCQIWQTFGKDLREFKSIFLIAKNKVEKFGQREGRVGIMFFKAHSESEEIMLLSHAAIRPFSIPVSSYSGSQGSARAYQVVFGQN